MHVARIRFLCKYKFFVLFSNWQISVIFNIVSELRDRVVPEWTGVTRVRRYNGLAITAENYAIGVEPHSLRELIVAARVQVVVQ